MTETTLPEMKVEESKSTEDEEGLLKKIGKKAWDLHRPIRQINKSIPKGLGHLAKGGIKMLFPDEKTKQEIDTIGENLNKKYNEHLGIEDGSWEDKTGKLIGEIATPLPGGKLKWLSKAGGAMLGGGLFGALNASADNENIPKEALTGGLLGGLGSKIGGKLAKRGSKAKLKKFEDIKKGAHITDPEEILRQAEILGEGATIPEAVKILTTSKRSVASALEATKSG